jgi:hypothetical protein
METERVFLMARRVSMIATVDRDPEIKYLPDGQAVAHVSVGHPPGLLVVVTLDGPISSHDVRERSDELTVRGKVAEVCGEVPRQGTETPPPWAVRGVRTRMVSGSGLSSPKPFISLVHCQKGESAKT